MPRHPRRVSAGLCVPRLPRPPRRADRTRGRLGARPSRLFRACSDGRGSCGTEGGTRAALVLWEIAPVREIMDQAPIGIATVDVGVEPKRADEDGGSDFPFDADHLAMELAGLGVEPCSHVPCDVGRAGARARHDVDRRAVQAAGTPVPPRHGAPTCDVGTAMLLPLNRSQHIWSHTRSRPRLRWGAHADGSMS